MIINTKLIIYVFIHLVFHIFVHIFEEVLNSLHYEKITLYLIALKTTVEFPLAQILYINSLLKYRRGIL